jgi:hypothetical protein
VFIGVLGGLIRTRRLRRLGPIIHLPDLKIRILLPPNTMPPAIHIMRQRPRAHLPETVELGDIFNANYNIPITHKSQIAILQNIPLLVYSSILENDRISAVFH